jgi:DNA replication licensing factor MCM4
MTHFITPFQFNDNEQHIASYLEQELPSELQIRTKDQVHELSRDPQIYDRLVRSIAPSIWELEDVKRGILCLLFGGANSEAGAASARFRGELNVLMCGDRK